MNKLLIILIIIPELILGQYKTNKTSSFDITKSKTSTTIYYAPSESKLINITANLLAEDIERVTNKKPKVVTSLDKITGNIIIIGTLGNNTIINQLSTTNPEFKTIKGSWERHVIKTIDQPFPNIKKALVIVGSDKRGAAYGAFSISEKIGVSPWYWWADVPVIKQQNLTIEIQHKISESPKVKYRGIFLNDEAPALSNWAKEKFGGFTPQFYKHIFELLLRLKANYLWPAMWSPSAFNANYPENPKLANDYGIVMSTSHHEPMMRAHAEWRGFKGGAWNYETNQEQLQEFWQGGIERMGDYESVITMGMRGDGDEAMGEGTAIKLLQKIIKDQRKIIEDVTKKPADETPQVWALYKEVQDYYDEGMRVDDDITLLFCDDNWGNVRVLPKKNQQNYKGGYGMYYHFDYVGGPTSYRWQNVTQIERVWEQMSLTYNWGVDRLWIVNVGDLKPMEFPISFFLDFAWNPKAIKADDLPNYYTKWSKQQFGDSFAKEIGDIISLYTKYNGRRTPETLKPNTYSLEYYREADKTIRDFKALLSKSKEIYKKLPKTYKSAFYQLVLSPIEMCCNLNDMYVCTGKNQLYANQGRVSTNLYADKVTELFNNDAKLTNDYHTKLENGKWNHMMSQTHIGYTSWDNPKTNKMPSVSYIEPKENASLGYTIEHGNKSNWEGLSGDENHGAFSKSFANFDPLNNQNYYIDVFNRGLKPLQYTITSKQKWINISKEKGSIQLDEKVDISINWKKAPKTNTTGEIEISGGGKSYRVQVPIRRDIPKKAKGFVENNGVIAIEAANFTKKHETKDINWTIVPNLGRTNSSVIVEPVNANTQTPSKNTPYLEYDFTLFDTNDITVNTYLSPTLNYKKEDGLKFAIAIDDEKPQLINMHQGETVTDWKYPKWWNNSVTARIKIKQSKHTGIKSGKHTLRVWMVDPGVVFQKFVIDAGGLKPSYLGAPESKYIKP